MTDQTFEEKFEHELAARALKYSDKIINPDMQIAAEVDFKKGARWARKETLREVCVALRENYLNGGKGMADYIEQKFMPESGK